MEVILLPITAFLAGRIIGGCIALVTAVVVWEEEEEAVVSKTLTFSALTM